MANSFYQQIAQSSLGKLLRGVIDIHRAIPWFNWKSGFSLPRLLTIEISNNSPHLPWKKIFKLAADSKLAFLCFFGTCMLVCVTDHSRKQVRVLQGHTRVLRFKWGQTSFTVNQNYQLSCLEIWSFFESQFFKLWQAASKYRSVGPLLHQKNT